MSRYIVILMLLLPCFKLWASDPFAELEWEMTNFEDEKANSQSLEDEFQQFIESQQSDYQIWQKQYLQEFDQFQQEIIAQWGKGEPVKAGYDVEFNETKNVKSVVDYDNEKITVELLVDKNLSSQEAEKALQKQVDLLLTNKQSNIAQVLAGNKIDEKPVMKISEVEFSQSNKQKSQNIIVEQTQSQAQEIDKKADRAILLDNSLTENEARLLATEEKKALLKSTQVRLDNSEKSYKNAQANAKNDTKIVSYTVSLPKNSLQKRASKYVVFAQNESQINQIPAPLIMAIMHSESAFNPKAKSAVPAYGLMQIVPSSAGHDVNKLVRNIDKPMQVNDLYVPKINVETGSAYLNILDKRYLKKINNDQSRLYCTIAAYNTGAGNVARVFNKDGSRNINKAAQVINQLSPDEVYQQLLNKLPYDETKHYLQRVNSRIALYQPSL